MKFKLGLAMTLCIALGTANVVAFAGENASVFNAPATAITVGVTATETPATETPAVEAPVVEAPVVDTPAVETPAVETPAVETPAVETPAVETPAVETPAVEIIEIPEVEIPLAEVAQEAATLKIVHRTNTLFETTQTEELITGLVAGESIHTTDYAHLDANLAVLSESKDVEITSGENEIVIDYLLLSELIDINAVIVNDEMSVPFVEEVSAE